MRRIVSIFLMMVLILTPVATFAGNYDFINKTDSEKRYSFIELENSPSLAYEVWSNIADYNREGLGGKIYDARDIQIFTNQGNRFNQAAAILDDPSSITASAEFIITGLDIESWDITIVGALPDYVTDVVVNGEVTLERYDESGEYDEEALGGFETIGNKLAVNFDGIVSSLTIYYGSRAVEVTVPLRVARIDGLSSRQESFESLNLDYSMNEIRRSPSILRSILANINNR